MAYLETTTGFKKTIYWTVDEIKRHAMRYSQTYKKGYGLWVDNFDAMAKKTLIKHIIMKFAPKSIELQNAAVNDQASFAGDIDNPQPVYVDSPTQEDTVDFEEVEIIVEPTDEEIAAQQQQDQNDATEPTENGELNLQ